MAKKTVIQDRVKIRGIRKRWLVNSMGVVTLILLLAMGTLTLSLWAYYEGSMRDNLSSRASDTARSFSVYTRREYRTAAQDYVAKFPDKQKLEVQFIETDGSLLCTSYGLTTSGTMPGTPDITGAMESGDVKPWTGQDPQTGERIMAVSSPDHLPGDHSGRDPVRHLSGGGGPAAVPVHRCMHPDRDRHFDYGVFL